MTHRIILVALSMVLAATALAAQAPAPSDSLPAHYSLLFERGPIRVLKYAGGPGDSTSMHSHPPHFAYVIKGGLLRFTYPNGRAIEAPLRTGLALDIAHPLTHTVKVLGSDSVAVLIVEYQLPDSAAGPAARGH